MLLTIRIQPDVVEEEQTISDVSHCLEMALSSALSLHLIAIDGRNSFLRQL
jgi:hypothetical protein